MCPFVHSLLFCFCICFFAAPAAAHPSSPPPPPPRRRAHLRHGRLPEGEAGSQVALEELSSAATSASSLPRPASSNRACSGTPRSAGSNASSSGGAEAGASAGARAGQAPAVTLASRASSGVSIGGETPSGRDASFRRLTAVGSGASLLGSHSALGLLPPEQGMHQPVEPEPSPADAEQLRGRAEAEAEARQQAAAIAPFEIDPNDILVGERLAVGGFAEVFVGRLQVREGGGEPPRCCACTSVLQGCMHMLPSPWGHSC